MRALEPRITGYAVNPDDGVRTYYEIFGPEDAKRTIVFLPTWMMVHSRIWKMQVPYFAEHGFRVVTFDARGNGKSDRPESGYSTADVARDTQAVFDHLDIQRAVVVGLSAGGRWGIPFVAGNKKRVSHLILIGPGLNLSGGSRHNLDHFLDEPPDREGWNKYNAVHWREDYRNFVEWFSALASPEPHSSKAIDDAIGWALETDPEILISSMLESPAPGIAEQAASITCPTLIIYGDNDQIVTRESIDALHAIMPNSHLVIAEGSGHNPAARDAVWANLLIHDFIGRDRPKQSQWRRAMARTAKRALFVSSPIGLGHVQRDLAIARELRMLVPGMEIDWLAQHPVTTALDAAGECIHPMSERLASESAHLESEMTGEHELQAFRAFRTMDEIMLANFHVFLDAAQEGNYDLWIGDEAWEVDHYLHENPELKTAPYVWMTDVVGYLPVEPDSDGREEELTTDYNAELIEHIERFPHVRDRSIYIGNPQDLPPGCFGAGLPSIRDWSERHHDFVGYPRYFDPEMLPDRRQLREHYGFQPEEQVVVAAVGGTRAGVGLLRRIIESFPAAREAIPHLRFVVVRGPRINATDLPDVPGVEQLGYVDNLYQMLVAADAALVQGGLSTTMELVVGQKPFLYFPLVGHFEQNRYVAHRLERYGVPPSARIQYRETNAECIAGRLSTLLDNPPHYHAVEEGGARRAAEKIAELLT